MNVKLLRTVLQNERDRIDDRRNDVDVSTRDCGVVIDNLNATSATIRELMRGKQDWDDMEGHSIEVATECLTNELVVVKGVAMWLHSSDPTRVKFTRIASDLEELVRDVKGQPNG